MIELSWANKDDSTLNVLMNMTQILAWVTEQVNKAEEKIIMNGYIVVTDGVNGVSTLLLCDDAKSNKFILNLLMQPPGEFSGKYFACILSGEPEKKEEEKEEEEESEPG